MVLFGLLPVRPRLFRGATVSTDSQAWCCAARDSRASTAAPADSSCALLLASSSRLVSRRGSPPTKPESRSRDGLPKTRRQRRRSGEHPLVRCGKICHIGRRCGDWAREALPRLRRAPERSPRVLFDVVRALRRRTACGLKTADGRARRRGCRAPRAPPNSPRRARNEHHTSS